MTEIPEVSPTLRGVILTLVSHVSGINPDTGRKVGPPTTRAKAAGWSGQLVKGVADPLQEIIGELESALGAVADSTLALEEAQTRAERVEAAELIDEHLNEIYRLLDVDALGLGPDWKTEGNLSTQEPIKNGQWRVTEMMQDPTRGPERWPE